MLLKKEKFLIRIKNRKIIQNMSEIEQGCENINNLCEKGNKN